MAVCRSCLLILLLLAGSISVAHAEKRVALVVGISNYRHIPPLANTANDARDMATMLRQTGFDLIGGGPQLDPDKAALENLIQDFGRRLGGDTVGLFYYSGHGVQMNGSNYLVPSQANVSSAADVKYELVDAAYVLDEMSGAGNRLNIVILDACRNNPFAGRNLRGIAPGLSQVTAPAGTVIGYATQPGNVAYDGEGDHSPYSAALLEAMSLPGLDIFRMLNTVGVKVKTVTGGRQQPWLAVSPIEGSFEFVPRRAGGPAEPVTPPPTVVAAGSSPESDRPLAASPAAPPAATATTRTMDICPDTFTAFRGTTAPLTCGCAPGTLRVSANVYGTDIYADVSPICRAALHAGAVGWQGGTIGVTPREEPPLYPGVTRNGVTSQSNQSNGAALSAPPGLLDTAGRPVQAPIAETLKKTGRVQMYINFVTDSADLQPNAEVVLRDLLKAATGADQSDRSHCRIPAEARLVYSCPLAEAGPSRGHAGRCDRDAGKLLWRVGGHVDPREASGAGGDAGGAPGHGGGATRPEGPGHSEGR